jgi:hypothetical protein
MKINWHKRLGYTTGGRTIDENTGEYIKPSPRAGTKYRCIKCKKEKWTGVHGYLWVNKRLYCVRCGNEQTSSQLASQTGKQTDVVDGKD